MGVTSGLSRPPATYALAGVMAVGCGVSLFGTAWQPERFWANLLVVSYGILGLGLGGTVLLALLFVTGARWSDIILPVVTRLTMLLPMGGAGVWLVLLACPALYPWTATTAEPASSLQGVWLSRPFFLLRATVYLGLWIGFTLALVRTAPRSGDPRTHRGRLPRRLRADMLAGECRLDHVAGAGVVERGLRYLPLRRYVSRGAGRAHRAARLAGPARRFAGRLTRDHRRDLGTLLFAFSSFWMYIWFCQYLLIWFVNNPEETQYYLARQHDPWPALLLASLALNWAVPFLVLLMRPAKENGLVLATVATGVLVGRWLDLYLMVLPPVAGDAVLSDAGLFVSAAALAGLVLARRRRVKRPLS